MVSWTFWVLSALVFCSETIGYKILVVDPLPAKSHYNLGKAVVDILFKRGHEVTFINAFPSEKPSDKYREIGITSGLAMMKDKKGPSFDMEKQSKISLLVELNQMFPLLIKKTLSDPQVVKLMTDKNEKFDLVIVEYFMNEAYAGFGVKFDCPVIMLSPVSMMHWLARASGNTVSPATVPNVFLSYISGMTLMERVVNTGMGIVQEFLGWAMLSKSQRSLYEEYFPEEAAKVSYSELNKKIALVLSNTHPSLGIARPLLPNVVEIGGYHIGDPAPLTEEYKKILDNAKNGVIFFSMGSNLKSADMPENVRNDILKALSKVKETVLWKFETDLPGKPDNVIIRSWMPQPSILNHPNVKLFISHGGLLSTTEAAASGVPLLAIPIFGDQHHNAKSTEKRGNGLSLVYTNLTEASLTWALNEMLSNPKYTQKAKEIYKTFNDRPMHPRDLISFYVEHVIRTGGAPHLSAPQLCLVSDLLLDVAFVLLAPPLIILILFVFLCKRCCRKTPKQKVKKN